MVNDVANSVSEWNASTGALVRVIYGPRDQFDGPDAVALAGNDFFVDGLGGTLTEIDASTGSFVRVISGPTFTFGSAHAMAVAGDNLFVANNPFPGGRL